MPTIGPATGPVSQPIVRILKIHAIQELVAVPIIDAVRPCVVAQNAEPLSKSFLNTDQTAVVIRVSSAIGLHNARIVFAEIRVRQIKLTTLIQITGRRTGACSS